MPVSCHVMSRVLVRPPALPYPSCDVMSCGRYLVVSLRLGSSVVQGPHHRKVQVTNFYEICALSRLRHSLDDSFSDTTQQSNP